MSSKINEIISFNPATTEEIGRVKKFSADEVFEVVERSRKAQKIWQETSFPARRRVVMKAREVILAEMDEIARLISDETGKPVAEALFMEIAPILDLMQFFAKKTEKMLRPERINLGPLGFTGRSSKIVYKPLGVVGIISPWNFPLSISLGEIVMALMVGNTVILKPSELTPLVGEKIGEIFKIVHLPENTLQIVSGNGETGAALVNAGVDKIMFTGSVETGKKIAKEASKTLTPVVLELGGKDPMIVFADANLERASSAAVWGAFTNSGQACSSVERLYVEANISEKFTEMIVKKTRKLRQGIGKREETDIGSMTNKEQLEIVEDHVKDFEKSGAEILTGGKRNSGVKGYFFEPTVIKKAKNSMRPMREETFGPTLPIATFKNEEEAIMLANDTDFGLTASVWTGDLSRGEKIAERILAGTVHVNEVLYTHGIGQTPWGGFKNSGYGRTHGKEGLMELVATQHLHINRFLFIPDFWWFGYSKNAIMTFKKMARTISSGSILKTLGFLPQMWKRIREMKK